MKKILRYFLKNSKTKACPVYTKKGNEENPPSLLGNANPLIKEE